MAVEYYDYLKFIDDALELAKAIPRYFSKFSNKIYCNHQKLAIYILMQKLKTTSRGIISILRANSDMLMRLSLNRIPVHTTILRFVNKIRKQISKLLAIRQADTIAVDATGFELETKSYYYRKIWNSKKLSKTKNHMKLSLVVDTTKQLILNYKIRKSRAHDTRDFKFLLKEIRFNNVVADKGYDDKKLRSYVFKIKKAMPIIPVRRHSKFYGYYHNKKISGDIYHQRSKVETIFSCIKRKYGSVLRNRTFATQKVELISKLIAYNVDRMQHYVLLILEGCTRALFEILISVYNNY